MKSLGILVVLVLQGCAAVETYPIYQSRNAKWTSEVGGNPLKLKLEAETIEMSVVGIWPQWVIFGPLFFPLFPWHTSDDIGIAITAEPSTIANIKHVTVLANGASLQPIRRRAGKESILFTFRPSAKRPTELVVKVDGLPEAELSVGQETCYWYGDSEEIFIGCSEAAKSATHYPSVKFYLGLR